MSTIYTLNSKVLKNTANDKWLIKKAGLPPIPANTVRVRTNDGEPPIKLSYGAKYDSATLVAGTTDVYDVYKSGTSFEQLLSWSTNVVEVLGANTTGITNMDNMFSNAQSLTSVQLFDTSSVISMHYMFSSCASLTTVPLFDTSSVRNISYMFYACNKLETVPLFDTSSVTNMSNMFSYCRSLTTVPLFDTSSLYFIEYMFRECTNVQTGALALYQQVSTQASPPTHTQTFRNCGSNTTTGAAELAQIPSDWK